MASQDGYQPIDIINPFEIRRTWRDIQIDVLTPGTVGIVNSGAFAQTLDLYLDLDSYLTFATPFQQVLEKHQEIMPARLNMPSRTGVRSLAQRMTDVAFRLDAGATRLDELFPVCCPHSGNRRHAAAPDTGELAARLQALDERTGQVIEQSD